MMENPQHAMQVLPQLGSLNRVVLDLMNFYQPAFALKRLGSGLDLDQTLPLTWIDAPQLEHGLANLLRNAVKYTRGGDVVVLRTVADGDWVQLTIGDSGPRVGADRAAAMFAPAQGESVLAEGRRSLRLGLDLCRSIVAAHGGEITLDRSHGSGAWFVVRLPAIALENARLVEKLDRDHRRQYDLVARLSHELRTPLNVIMGYKDLLLDGAFGRLRPPQADTLHRVDNSGRELLELINATVDLSRHTEPSHDDSTQNGRHPAHIPFSDWRQPTSSSAATLASLAQRNAWLAQQLEYTKRLKSEFVTTTSHQLRVPLTAIIGYNDLLLDGEFGSLSTEQAGILHRVRKSALELLDAINRNLVNLDAG